MSEREAELARKKGEVLCRWGTSVRVREFDIKISILRESDDGGIHRIGVTNNYSLTGVVVARDCAGTHV